MQHPIIKPLARSIAGQVHLSWYKAPHQFAADIRAGQEQQPWPTRIYRQTETTFVRGEDYEEFFLGRSLEQGELIFEGLLEPRQGRKFSFVDTSAHHRTTYSYYLAIGEMPAIGPVPVRHVDPEVYWSADRLEKELDHLLSQARFKQVPVALDACGTTAGGRPIPRLRLGDRGPRLVLVGLIHPGESGPELIVGLLQRLLEEADDLLRRVQILALPAVNRDARELQAQGVPWYLRCTVTGVDLNRNFPADWHEPALGYGLDSRDPDAMTYRGPAPASAPETQAVMAALEAEPPAVLLSYHALASLCSLPMLYPIQAAEDQAYAARCQAIGRAFAAGGFAEAPFEDRWVRPGCTAGSLPRWVHQRFGAPALDLEIGATDPEAAQHAKTDHVDAALLASYQQRHAGALKAVLQWLTDGDSLGA